MRYVVYNSLSYNNKEQGDEKIQQINSAYSRNDDHPGWYYFNGDRLGWNICGDGCHEGSSNRTLRVPWFIPSIPTYGYFGSGSVGWFFLSEYSTMARNRFSGTFWSFAANIVFWNMITEYGVSHSGLILHTVFMLIESLSFAFYNNKDT